MTPPGHSAPSPAQALHDSWDDVLACLRCHGNLIPRDEALQCSRCDALLRIERGVLVTIDHDTLTPHLASQVAAFEHERAIRGDTYALAPWQRRYVERWLDACGPVAPGMVVVDCGTGSGYMAIELARRGARVVACDLTLTSMRRLARIAANEGLGDRILTICCTAEQLPIRTDIVSSFIANGLLEHVPDEAAALREWARVCATDSTLMVTVPVRFALVHPLLIGVQWWRDRQVGHLRRYDLGALRRALRGWSLRQAIYTGHWAKAWRVLANLTRVVHFEEEALESLDHRHEAHARRSSNLISFWHRAPAP